VWLLRRLATEVDARPEGFELNLAETARALGVGMRGGKNSPFVRSIERSCRFGAARFAGRDTLAVRRKLPPLTLQQVERLPERLRREHAAFVEAANQPPPLEQLRSRAQRLALSLLELGETPDDAERQLHRWRFHPALAHEAVRWAQAERAAVSGAG